MNKEGLGIFRESLNCLRYSGMTVKAFAEKINMKPQSLYNYRNGQMPSPQGFRYIMVMLKKKCPEALRKGMALYKASQEEKDIIKYISDDKEIDNNENKKCRNRG